MSLYEREYGGDWHSLDKEEATERAYAIGVAEKLGEYNRDELEAIYDEVDSAYKKSMVELAYREGRQEANEAAKGSDGDEVWAQLVEGEAVTVDPEDRPTGGRDGLPEALEPDEVLGRKEIDSTDIVDRPEFLDR